MAAPSTPLCRRTRRHLPHKGGEWRQGNPPRRQDDQPPDGGFRRAEDAGDTVAQVARQGGRRCVIRQTGQREKRRDDAQQRLAVLLDRT